MKIETEVLEKLVDLANKTDITNKSTYTGERKLYPSSFPYCGLRELYKSLEILVEHGKIPIEDDIKEMALSYYGNAGTALHNSLQEWLGKLHILDKKGVKEIGKVKILGNWHCLDYKCATRKCVKEGCKKVNCTSSDHGTLIKLKSYRKCKVCGGPSGYSEIPIVVGKISGKIDGVLRIEINRVYLYFVIDYKTSNTDKVENHKRYGNIFPSYPNKLQIEFYAAYFEKIYGIKISGWILAYFARDNPVKTKAFVSERLSNNDKKMIRSRIKRYDKHFEIVNDVINLEQPDTTILIAEKPCRSYEQYRKTFHAPWSVCPLSEKRCCFKPSELKKKISSMTKQANKSIQNTGEK